MLNPIREMSAIILNEATTLSIGLFDNRRIATHRYKGPIVSHAHGNSNPFGSAIWPYVQNTNDESLTAESSASYNETTSRQDCSGRRSSDLAERRPEGQKMTAHDYGSKRGGRAFESHPARKTPPSSMIGGVFSSGPGLGPVTRKSMARLSTHCSAIPIRKPLLPGIKSSLPSFLTTAPALWPHPSRFRPPLHLPVVDVHSTGRTSLQTARS